MIITLIAFGLLIVGIAGYIISNRRDASYLVTDFFFGLVILQSIAALLVTLVLILSHTNIDHSIQVNRMEHDSIVARLEIADTGYENIAYSEAIKDAMKWNVDVEHQKYFCNNPWFSWFFDKRLVDDLEYIDYKQK